MVYFRVQPTNRPTNTIYILIISELHVGWYVNQPNQPDQPPQFRRKRIRDASRYTIKKNIAQVFILERYFFVSIYPAASHGTCLALFLAAVLPLC